jgi:hypothetical protein
MEIEKSSFSALLSQPYPFYYEGKKVYRHLAVIFILVFFLKYLLQPFEVNYQEQKLDYFWISIIHSASPVMVLLLFTMLLLQFPKKSDDWTIKKEFVFVLFLFFFTGIANFLMRDIIYTNPGNWSWRYFYEEIRNTCIAGTFLAFIIIPFNFNRLQARNQRKATSISERLPEPKEIQKDKPVQIATELKSDDFIFEVNDFLYAESEGNYLDLYFMKNDEVIKLVKRITLKGLESQLSDFKFIVKTHRSVILNLNAVEKVAGNAQGYKVKLKNYPTTIPVSRGFISTFENALTIL